ncbi:hypothetical protein Pfo_017120 [Paulownia fortunei]|nr:hypothetical protein Pfo_017120 [Paulownia fortunei]
MKKMESEIISSESVRPSSPTPQHLQTYKLSMLDQIVPPMLVPLVLYFSNTVDSSDPELFTSQTIQLLKRSLSVILTRFYPLAGRVNRDGQSIDCNNQGVPFVVVKFTGQKLSDLLTNPDPNLPRRLVPCEITWDSEQCPDSCVALIQVSYFDCGGIAIGAVFWHKVADAMTIGTFLNSWAAITRGSREAVCPNYIAQSMFPHKEEMPRQSGSLAAILKAGKSVMRRYVFDASAISSLKAKSAIERPTRVEVVSALIWKCFMAASLANNNSVSLVTHAVNLRRRAQPPFPSDCFGNFPGLAAATSNNENGKDLGHLVRKMRDAISKIDNDFINRMHGDEGFWGYRENLRLTWSEIPEGADLLSISSWCSFGLYGADFGWGKPIWLTRCDAGTDSESRFLNVVWLMDTRVGDGIEAWVILDEKYMSVFDNVEELRALATSDPSPLDIDRCTNQV